MRGPNCPWPLTQLYACGKRVLLLAWDRVSWHNSDMVRATVCARGRRNAGKYAISDGKPRLPVDATQGS